MDAEDAWAVLARTSTFESSEARRLAAMAVLELDSAPATIDRLIDAVDGAARRQAPLAQPARALLLQHVMIADVVISGVLRHHPRADIAPVFARRLADLRASHALWMAEALSFVLARRALETHRETIEALWLRELGEPGHALAEKWGDDAMKARLR